MIAVILTLVAATLVAAEILIVLGWEMHFAMRTVRPIHWLGRIRLVCGELHCVVGKDICSSVLRVAVASC